MGGLRMKTELGISRDVVSKSVSHVASHVNEFEASPVRVPKIDARTIDDSITAIFGFLDLDPVALQVVCNTGKCFLAYQKGMMQPVECIKTVHGLVLQAEKHTGPIGVQKCVAGVRTQ
jgi:hypothetical protein